MSRCRELGSAEPAKAEDVDAATLNRIGISLDLVAGLLAGPLVLEILQPWLKRVDAFNRRALTSIRDVLGRLTAESTGPENYFIDRFFDVLTLPSSRVTMRILLQWYQKSMRSMNYSAYTIKYRVRFIKRLAVVLGFVFLPWYLVIILIVGIVCFLLWLLGIVTQFLSTTPPGKYRLTVILSRTAIPIFIAGEVLQLLATFGK